MKEERSLQEEYISVCACQLLFWYNPFPGSMEGPSALIFQYGPGVDSRAKRRLLWPQASLGATPRGYIVCVGQMKFFAKGLKGSLLFISPIPL